GHDLRHRASESDSPAQHEPLEILLTFPELRPRLVGSFELEIRGDVSRDFVDRDPAGLNVDEERRVPIGAREDDLRGDPGGLLPPLRVRVEAARNFVEESLREVLHHGRRLRGPEAGRQEKASGGVTESPCDGKGFTDRGLCAAARGYPSLVKGEGLKIPSRRASQVRILAHASLTHPYFWASGS